MKRTVFKVIATVLLTLISLLFTVGMYQFGAAVSRGGVGSQFFIYLVKGPQGLCLIVWPILGALLPWTRLPKIALGVVCLALIPPIWGATVLSLEGVQDDVIRDIWRNARPIIYIFSAFYLLPSILGVAAGLRGAILILKDLSKAKAD